MPRTNRAQKTLADNASAHRLREFAQVLIDIASLPRDSTMMFPEVLVDYSGDSHVPYSTPRTLRVIAEEAAPLEDRLARMETAIANGAAPRTLDHFVEIRFLLSVPKSRISPDVLRRLREIGLTIHVENRSSTWLALCAGSTSYLPAVSPDRVRLLAEVLLLGYVERVVAVSVGGSTTVVRADVPRVSQVSDMDALLGAVDPASRLGAVTAKLREQFKMYCNAIDNPSTSARNSITQGRARYTGPAQTTAYLRGLCAHFDAQHVRSTRESARGLLHELAGLQARGFDVTVEGLLASVSAEK
jgi:hypothetical protein